MTTDRKPVSISTLLFNHSPRLLVLAVAIGAAAGALYSLIIPFVLAELNRSQGGAAGAPDPARVGLFFGICALILVAKASSVILVNNIAKSATAALRESIAAKISRMKIDQVESVGFARLLTILTDDVNRVASAAVAIPMVLVSGVTVIGMLGYLATLNLPVFALVLLAIGLGVALFQVPVSIAGRLYQRARVLRDVVQEGIRGLVMGVYELKLNPGKSQAYLEQELAAPQQRSVRLEKLGDALIHVGGSASDMLSFFIIGLVVFVLPQYLPVPASGQYGVVMAMLYIAGPVASILGMMQQLTMGRVSIARIAQLNDQPEEAAAVSAAGALPAWSRFSARGVTYAYPAQEHGFALQPISLDFRRGQINFIVGGNGSGKSTLSKLLSLHYEPASGAVFFDELPIDAANLVQARDRIAVIYSNYHLFSRLYRGIGAGEQARIDGYLAALGLEGKTRFVDGRFTATRLSDGQRRRLALLVALMEDKEIYVFDEWAADQDPEFKRIFYQEILMDMRANGKLVIVITHDDRYFDCADRVIFMEDGRVIDVRDNPDLAAPPAPQLPMDLPAMC